MSYSLSRETVWLWNLKGNESRQRDYVVGEGGNIENCNRRFDLRVETIEDVTYL